jgi:hypothetical protein
VQVRDTLTLANMRLLFLLIAILTGSLAFADQPRIRLEFKSPNKKFTLKAINSVYDTIFVEEYGIYHYKLISRTWALYKGKPRNSKTPLYSFEHTDISSKTALVSNDGQFITIIDDYSEYESSEDLVSLEFLQRGMRLSTIQMSQLLGCTNNVSRSVSHFTWCWIWFDGQKLEIQTYELTNYQFDIETGQITSSKIASEIEGEISFVYGEFLGEENGSQKLKVCHLIKGSIPKNGIIYFKGLENPYRKSYYTIIVKDGEVLDLPYLRNVMLNSCNFHYLSSTTTGDIIVKNCL